jgi:hypothetical protein
MAALNLFASLSKWRTIPENFATAGLAWLIGHDSTARAAFFQVCRSALGTTKNRRRAHDALARFDAVPALDVRTQEGIFLVDSTGTSQCVYPDIRIQDDACEVCCLVEVKLWAPPTRHRGRASVVDGSDDVADLDDETVQTRSYRAWLDQHYEGGRGLLFALSVEPQRELSVYCDAAVTWNDLGRELRRRSDTPIAREFCAYLYEERIMDKPAVEPLTVEDATRLRSAALGTWDKWQVLLNAIVEALTREIKTCTKFAAKIKRSEERDFTLTLEPASNALWIYTTWIVCSGQDYFELTPCVVCNDKEATISLNIWSRRLRRLNQRTLRQRVQARVDPDDRYTTFYLAPLPDWFQKASVVEQADAVAKQAMTAVVLRLADDL